MNVATDLMATLHDAGPKLDMLREGFRAHPGGVDEGQFVRLVETYLRDNAAGSAPAPGESSLDGSVSFSAATSVAPLKLSTAERDMVRKLFHTIDYDGSGVVSWEELYEYTINTTMNRLRPRPSGRIRPYAKRRHVPREDNVQ